MATKIKFIPLSPCAIPPSKNLYMGYNIYTPYDYEIKPGEKECIKTDLLIQPPYGFYAKIEKNENFLFNQHIIIDYDIFDSNKKQEIFFNIKNCNDEIINIKRKTIIGRIICYKKILFDMSYKKREICLNWNKGYFHDDCPYSRFHICKICNKNHQMKNHIGNIINNLNK